MALLDQADQFKSYRDGDGEGFYDYHMGGDGTRSLSGRANVKSIDCSHLLHRLLTADGHAGIPYYSTAQLLAGSASAHFQGISLAEVQTNDILVWAPGRRNDGSRSNSGHVGVFDNWRTINQVGSFFGSQSSTGPDRARFGEVAMKCLFSIITLLISLTAFAENDAQTVPIFDDSQPERLLQQFVEHASHHGYSNWAMLNKYTYKWESDDENCTVVKDISTQLIELQKDKATVSLKYFSVLDDNGSFFEPTERKEEKTIEMVKVKGHWKIHTATSLLCAIDYMLWQEELGYSTLDRSVMGEADKKSQIKRTMMLREMAEKYGVPNTYKTRE